MEVTALRQMACLLGCRLQRTPNGHYMVLDAITHKVVHGPKLTLKVVSEWLEQQGEGYAFINTRARNNLMADDKGGKLYRRARTRYECFISEYSGRLTKEAIEAEATRIVGEVTM